MAVAARQVVAAVVLAVALPAAAAGAEPSSQAGVRTCLPPAGLVYVGDDSTPPHEFIDEHGRPAGFTVDLINTLARELGVAIDIRLMARAKAIAAIESGEAQLIHLGHTLEREQRFDYLGQVARVRGSVLLRHGLRPNASSLADLAGLTVAVERDTLTQELFAGLSVSQRINVTLTGSRQEAVELWAAGQVDGVAGSASAVLWLARKAGIADVVEVPYHHTTFELVTQKGCGAALSPFSSAIARLRTQGVLDALAETWMAPRPHEPFPWRLVAIASGLILICGLMGLIWMWSLRRQVRERTEALTEALLLQRSLTDQAQVAIRAKSAFLATMSHEIRTPLNAVIATASVLERSDLSHEQRELVDVIRTGGDSLLSVVSDILDFSKIEAGHLELERATFDVRSLLRSTVGLIERAAITKGLQVEANVDPRFPQWVAGDANRVRQVLLNLLSNAVKFTEHGHIRVAATTLDNGDSASTLLVSVTDTGLGIPADRVERLFAPFTQADSSTTRRFGGTGLGLAISRHLVEAMGGTLTVQSIPGVGSTFSLRIPLPVVPAAVVAPVPASDAEAWTQLRVLLAEDNPVNQLVEKRILATLGVRCDVANNGQEAVDAAVQSSYDVILLDLQMPVMDGIEAVRMLRRIKSKAWLVAVTADVTTETRHACNEAGFDDFLTKPVTVADFAAAFARVRPGVELNHAVA